MALSKDEGQSIRVLHIAGSAYARGFLTATAEALAETGRVRQSMIHLKVSRGGAPAAPPAGLFERVDEFPQLERVGALDAGLGLLRRYPAAMRDPESSLRMRLWTRAQWAHAASRLPDLASGYDIYHWHCFEAQGAPYIHLLPEGAKAIVTFWGSDLLKTGSPADHRRQQYGCERGALFTAASNELRGVFLARFGRDLEGRFRRINYGSKLLPEVDRQRGNREAARREFGIGEGRAVVTIGNSASAANQHLDVLRSLRSMPLESLKRVTLVTPFGYGDGDGSYKAKVGDELQASGAEWILLDRFLSAEEAARLRCVTDVCIHVPVSDQLSAAMCESVYGGAALITGSWLPYSPLREAKVPFATVNSVSDVGEALTGTLSRLDQARRETLAAREGMSALMSWERLKWRWLALYEEALRA